MAQKFLYIPNRLIDSTGISTGATISFYETGTSVLADVYTDSSLTTPADNPLTVAAGAAVPELYYAADVVLRVRVVYADGTIDDEDPWSYITAADLNFLQAGTGAVNRSVQDKAREIFSVRDFGAVGDGTTDDTAAIQAAIDAAQLSRATVYFPQPATVGQHYKITSPLRVVNPVSLVGANMRSVIIYGVGMTAAQYLLEIDGTANPNLEFVEVEGIRFSSNNAAPSNIKLNRAANCSFRNVCLGDGLHGIYVTGDRCYTNTFDRVLDLGGLTNATVRFEAFTGGGQFTFTGCSFSGNPGIAITSDSEVSSLAFLNCNFEQCGTNGFVSTGTTKGVSFVCCRAEKCTGSYTIEFNPTVGNEAFGTVVSGGFYETDAEAATVSFGGNGGNVRGFDIQGVYIEGYTTNFVRFNGEGESGSIKGNFIDRNLPNIVSAFRTNVEVKRNEYNNAGVFTKYANTDPA